MNKRLLEVIDKRPFRGSAVSMDHSLRSMPPLETLRAFEVAARSGSFSAAAEKLNLTHGAVSRQIAKLEAWLGLKVFDRGARGAAVVRLASIPSIGGLWLIPRLTALEGGTPPLRVVLEIDLRQTDLADEGI